MNLQGEIEDISTKGRTATIIATNALVHKIILTMSDHFAIPEEEIANAIEDAFHER